MSGVFREVYNRPYVVIFAAAVALSAHGLFTAAVNLGRIPEWLAWSYVLIVDLLAVSAYRTWRQAVESGRQHWACVVAGLAAAGTVAMNTLASYPELAAAWVGPAIAGFPPMAVLTATALRMAEQRLRSVTAGGGGINEPEPILIPTEEPDPVTAPVEEPAIEPDPASEPQPEPEPVTKPEPLVTPDRPAVTVTGPRLAAIPPVTADRADQVAADIVADIVSRHVANGGHVNDPELTRAVADWLQVSDRTARRKLQPFRGERAAA
jgi:hypothetical protein